MGLMGSNQIVMDKRKSDSGIGGFSPQYTVN
jgi:hypothetical protein